MVVDGEMQWHAGRADADDSFSGLAAAERLRLHHYDSLSLRHGYAPLSNPTENRSAAPGNINRWMQTPLDTGAVARLALPAAAEYLARPHTEYEYLRDHLGYRLEVRSVEASTVASPDGSSRVLELKVSLVNRGFSAPQNPRHVGIALLRRTKGNVTVLQEQTVQGVDVRRWQPFQPGDPRFTALAHSFSHTLAAGWEGWLRDGSVQVGLSLRDRDARLRSDPRFSIRLANAGVGWEGEVGGVNVLGNLSALAGV